MAGSNRFIFTVVLFLLGLGFLLYNTKYPLDTLGNPGPGVFPLLAGGALVILVLVQLVKDLRERQSAQSAAEDITDGKAGDSQEKKVLLMVVTFVVYLLLIHWLGFFTTNVFFVVATSRLLSAKDWVRPVVLAIGLNIFCYFLFEGWLKLSFPRGILF